MTAISDRNIHESIEILRCRKFLKKMERIVASKADNQKNSLLPFHASRYLLH